MKELLLFILLPLILLNDLDNYSINSLVNYLQVNGYYEVIEKIKKEYGDDVAIEFCKEFIQSRDCEEIVKVYIPQAINRRVRNDPGSSNKIEEISKTKNEELFSPQSEQAEVKSVDKKIGFIELLHQDKNIKVLRKFYNEKVIISKSLKIIKRKRLELLEPDIKIIEKKIRQKHKLVSNYN